MVMYQRPPAHRPPTVDLRARARRVLELAGSGLWQGELGEEVLDFEGRGLTVRSSADCLIAA